MQLGTILSGSPGEPCATKEVEFHLMRDSAQGRQRYRVKAVMLPVSEADRQAARRDAVSYLRTLPAYRESEGVSPPIPQGVVENEAVLKFLAYALHDIDNPLAKFVGSNDYHSFRSGLTVEQVLWLNKVYEKYIDDEYPELAPIVELESQALGK